VNAVMVWAISLASVATWFSVTIFLLDPFSASLLFTALIAVALAAFIFGGIALFGHTQRKLAIASILLTLCAVLVPCIFWLNGDPSPRVTRARIAATRVDLLKLKAQLDDFAKDNGRLPTENEGLDGLVECPAGLKATWRGPYTKEEFLQDAWDYPYFYRMPGKDHPAGYDLFSAGRDGMPDTSDDIKCP
jgi:general secretion pathway protein G